jgi:hypothetical protein
VLPERCRTAVEHFAAVVGSHARWAVDGSAALALQGIDVEPADVDILTDTEGAYRIQELLAEYAVKPVAYGETNRYRSHFGRFSVGGTEIDVMGDLKVYRNGTWSETQNPSTVKISQVVLGGNSIPVVSLDTLRATGYLSERTQRHAPRQDR